MLISLEQPSYLMRKKCDISLPEFKCLPCAPPARLHEQNQHLNEPFQTVVVLSLLLQTDSTSTQQSLNVETPFGKTEVAALADSLLVNNHKNSAQMNISRGEKQGAHQHLMLETACSTI